MGISAKELANIIQVSPATISMVFNNKPGISEATKEMVVQAAIKYGYSAKKSTAATPSLGIIHLVNYRKHGKIAANTSFFAQLTEGISQECSVQNHALRVSYFYENQDTDAKIIIYKARLTQPAICSTAVIHRSATCIPRLILVIFLNGRTDIIRRCGRMALVLRRQLYTGSVRLLPKGMRICAGFCRKNRGLRTLILRIMILSPPLL